MIFFFFFFRRQHAETAWVGGEAMGRGNAPGKRAKHEREHKDEDAYNFCCLNAERHRCVRFIT